MNDSTLNSKIESNKTRHYLAFSFSIIILLVILSNSIGFNHLSSVQKDVNQIIETQNAQIDLMHKMRSIARERIIKLQALVATTDSFEQDEIINEFHSLGGIFLETRQELKNTRLTEEENTLLLIQRELARKAVQSQYQVITLAKNRQNLDALNVLVNDTVSLQNENISHMDQFILYQNHQNQVIKGETTKKVNSAYKIVIILSFLSIIITIIVAFFVIQRISNMVKLLLKASQKNKQTAEELASAHELLEQKVAERTKKLEKANEALNHIAGHDSLTGLPNRRLFTELINQEINKADRNSYKLAVLYMDLDGFKSINDALGHDMGDAILVEVADRLRTSLRKEDLISRLGGDEFTICYTNIKQLEDINTLCRHIIEKIKKPIYIDKHQCQIGISIGISFFPEHGVDYTSLLRVADIAMYEVKKQGKNNFIIGN